jgi:alkyl hydroperoxide reductase subunit AhpF
VFTLGLISEEHKQRLREEFEARLKDEVHLVMFTQGCRMHPLQRGKQLVQEIAELSGLIRAEIHDFIKEQEKAQKYKVDKVLAIAVIGKKDHDLRYYGVPLGYEFKVFIDSIINVSGRATNLSEDSKRS